MIYNINGTLHNYVTKYYTATFGCVASALNDFSDYTDDRIYENIRYNNSWLRDQIDKPTIYFSSNNTVSIIDS